MNTTAMTNEIPPPLQMLQLISGFWVSRCLYVLAKLGVPESVKLRGRLAREIPRQDARAT